MSSYVPPKKNTAFIAYIGLPSAADPLSMKASPTLAAGDFKVSIDGGALANLATLPTNTPAGSTMVKLSLSAAEMNGDNITIVCIDQTGTKEWADVQLNLQTSAQTLDEMGTVIDSILVDTAEIGTAGAGLTNINLPNQTMDITGNITGNLSGSVGSVTGAVGSVTGAVGSVTGSVGSVVGLTPGNLDVAVSTRLASAGYTAPDNASIAAILVDTGTDIPALIAALNDLSAAEIRTALGLATANLDTQIATLATAASIAALNDLSAADILAAAYEGSETVQDFLRLARAALVGKASGLATTSVAFRDAADLKDRITATVDADGNRTAVTVDAT